MDSNLLFLGWSLMGLFLLFLPRFLLAGSFWLTSFHFAQEYPEKRWLIDTYTLLLIICLPLSIVLTARHFQTETFPVFFLFTMFIPLVGVGLLKGLIEIIFGVSSHLGLKRDRDYPLIRLNVLRTNLDFLKAFEYRYTQHQARIRFVGVVRVVVNLGVLVGLVYFLL